MRAHPVNHAADDHAFRKLCAVEPAFRSIARAADCIAFAERTILHAGPPFRQGEVSAPIRHSAIVAAVFEGWADDVDAAGRLIDSAVIRLAPAQDHGAVVPLAAVLSPSMRVQVVADAAAPTGRQAYSPLNGGSGPALRLGQLSPDVLTHLRWLHGELADVLEARLAAPIPLIPLADRGLAAGDDCHGRTAAATAQLVERLFPDAPTDPAHRRAREFLERSSSFFLNLWMAACKAMAGAAEIPGSSVTTAMGGNGIDFGVQLGGQPGRWWTAPAAPPRCQLPPDIDPSDVLPAIGDSALVDAMGFGAMAMHHAPEQAKALAALVTETSLSLGDALLMGLHPAFVRAPVRVAMSARRTVACKKPLMISLGALDRRGRRGRLAGGIASTPMQPLTAAVSALDRHPVAPETTQSQK